MKEIQWSPCRQSSSTVMCSCLSEHPSSDGGAKDAGVELRHFHFERCKMTPAAPDQSEKE